MATPPHPAPCTDDRSGRPLPKRKPNRLKNYDYTQNGAYFVTLCVQDRREILGNIVGRTIHDNQHPSVGATVLGRPSPPAPGRPSSLLDHPCMELSKIGQTVDNAIKYYNANLDRVIFDRYVIMPNHIHAIIIIQPKTGDRGQETNDRGRSPLQGIVRNLKSYVTKEIGFSPWEKSFHDHIIRDETDYEHIAEYIENNPANWKSDCFFIDTNA